SEKRHAAIRPIVSPEPRSLIIQRCRRGFASAGLFAHTLDRAPRGQQGAVARRLGSAKLLLIATVVGLTAPGCRDRQAEVSSETSGASAPGSPGVTAAGFGTVSTVT